MKSFYQWKKGVISYVLNNMSYKGLYICLRNLNNAINIPRSL